MNITNKLGPNAESTQKVLNGDSSEFEIFDETSLTVSNDYILGNGFKTDCTIKFLNHENGVVGYLDFNNSPVTFGGGDLDESAKIFCETVIKWMPQIIEKYINEKQIRKL